MALILHIETATSVCSVVLAENGKIIAEKKSIEQRAHAQFLTVYIEELLAESGFAFHQLDAICVSKGPGSYTGLRIGVAVAKGLCYATDKPLIAVNTLFSMAACLKKQLETKGDQLSLNQLFCPMIDARRLEVFTAIYDQNLNELEPTKALIFDHTSFTSYTGKELFFFGDGAEKLKTLINPNVNAFFIDDFDFSAMGMVDQAYEKYIDSQFEDVAYFEPFYLKEFVGNQRT